MPLQIPAASAIRDALRGSVQTELPNLDTSTSKRSFVGGLIKGVALTLYDFYVTLKRYADRQPFPQTATGADAGDFLFTGWWRPLTKLDPLPAAPARGYVAVTGIAASEVPVNAVLSGSGVTYKVISGASLVGNPLAAFSLTYASGLAIFETVSAHYLATGMSVAISGAAPAEYNGTVTIMVTAANEFTYVPASVPGSSPATGSPMATATTAAVLIEATEAGQATNVGSGVSLAFEAPPPGADGTAYVTFGGIAGGTDTETAESYRARVLEALGADYGMFTDDEISIVAKQVPGVTHVWVRKAMVSPPASWPLEGQVRVAFLRRNDANVFPSAQEVSDVKAHIVATLMPAHTAEDDVDVLSPVPKPVNHTFTSITPDTPGMRAAIRAALKQFYDEGTDWGVNVSEDDYRCAIRAATALDSGAKLKAFTLSAPVGDVTVLPDELAALGTISFV